MGSYRLSAAADLDIADIIEFGILRFGIDQVRIYTRELEEHLAVLSTNNNLGRDASELSAGLRRFSFGSHVIFYVNDDMGILVVRVLHHSRDFAKHL